MESLILLYLVTGGVLGGGAAWLFQQRKLRQAEERIEATDETTRQFIGKTNQEISKLNEELTSQQKQIDQRDQELADLNKKHAELAQLLATTHVEYRELVNQLRACEGKLAAAEAENRKIPPLTADLERKEEELRTRQREIETLTAARISLEEELAAEKKSLAECLIFVEGSHYLPGRVVRNLIASNRA
ncbi:hypothetical protein ACHHRT_01995 [Desulfurivibrio sp. D14AmB]|uniref:hypothetical protein n=1 Tax=Desulfurivibrio sp. D14AmB TaxID=3374370 RepID=UPI00376F2318